MTGRGTSKTAPAPTWTIAEVLFRHPQAASVFTRFRMACVGCPMAAFETPAEAARAYGLDPDAVLVAIKGLVAKQTLHLPVKVHNSKGSADWKRTHDA